MLARRLTTILPVMTVAEAIETTCIHRVAGLTGNRTALVTTRPFRAPHQPISDAGRIGGGHVPMPGEVSRAHHGVRFLDELPEFRRHVLEVLRQPLEDDVTSIQSPERPRPHGLGAAGGAQVGGHSHVNRVSAHLLPGVERFNPRNGRADCLETRRALAVNDFACVPALQAPS
jgi:Magnesium chelatase, subunit ChlI